MSFFGFQKQEDVTTSICGLEIIITNWVAARDSQARIKSLSVGPIRHASTHLHMSENDAGADRADAGDEERNGDLDGRLPPLFVLDAGELVLFIFATIAARAFAASARFWN